jgi:hypothetical protein
MEYPDLKIGGDRRRPEKEIRGGSGRQSAL